MFEYPSYVNRSKILRLNNQAFLKGDIGEIIVKHKVNWCHRTRELSPTYLETRENFVIFGKMTTFLQKYWYTIDLFKFVVENKHATNLELYEVKTRNMLSKSYIRYPVPAVTTR